jgi:Archaeal Type IV pilin, N-terminal/FG-GAP-like repeat
MNFDVRRRKTWAEEGGVSEVIGNILILMMTVVLFSGIIAFVQQMPVPEQSTKADFSASISFSSNYRHANLTMVHAGGKVLDSKIVKIVINVDNVNYAYNLSDDTGFSGTSWTTGKSWTQRIDGTTSGSVITVTVVDLEKSDAIWTSQVTGGIKGNPPNILQRYIDSNPSTSTVDAVKENDTFTLFVKVEDVDGDLNTATGVWINASGVNMPGSNGDHRVGILTNGWFTWTFGVVWNATAIDGSVIIIHASDNADPVHEAVSSFVVDITQLPSDEITINVPIYGDIGSSGLPAYLSYISSGLGHGFGFYKEAYSNGTPRGKADTSSPSTSFMKDENIFIRFASLTMSNLYIQNSLTITDTRTGNTYPPAFRENSTASIPFANYPSGGSAYVYECVFNTSNLPPSAYTVSMLLKNQPGSGQTPQNFQADQMITVGQVDRPDLFIPEVQLYKNGWTTGWGSSKDTAYDVSTSDANMVYVMVKVQNTDAVTSPSVSEIKIMDMSGGSQVFGVPPAGSMMSQIKRYDGERYNFTIALRLYNGDQWLPGTNAYTIYITRLNDSNEGVYSLSKQLWVKGAGGKADFFAGSGGLASGNSNFNTREYVHFVQNNNFFTTRILWQSESTPGSSTDYTVTAMGAGDIDGDGDKDMLVGLATWNKLILFENTLNIFGTWQSGSSITRPDGETYPITSITFGDINGDGDSDFAYSNSNSQVVLYNATYGSTGWVYNPTNKWTGSIAKIALQDMTGDGLADLVVLSGGKVWIYDIKYSYNPALDKNKARFAYTENATGIKDFDLEDMNGDGKVDILTTGTSGAFGTTAGVNVNYYETGAGTVRLLNPAVLTIEYGAAPVNLVSDTQTNDSKGLILYEDTLTGNAGKCSAIMRIGPSALTSNPDWILRVRARVSPGNLTSAEVFYVQVSADGLYYTMVGQIDDTSWRTYEFALPPIVASTLMYVKVTDSVYTNSSASVQDSVELDYVGAVTDLFRRYNQVNVLGATTWKAVRAADIDRTGSGYAYKEVVVATNGANNIQVLQYTTGWGLMSGTAPSVSSGFFAEISTLIDGSKYPFSSLSPTLFDVVDINGDGFSDILACTMVLTGSGSGATYTSTIGFYMNTYTGGSQSWRQFQAKSWSIVGNSGGSTADPWVTVAIAANLNPS